MEIRAIVRLVIYVIGALAGLAAAVLASLGAVDHVALLTAIAGAAATITGGTAAYNIERGRDHQPSVAELIAALRGVVTEAQATRTGSTKAEVDAPSADDAVGKHRADTGFSIYH